MTQQSQKFQISIPFLFLSGMVFSQQQKPNIILILADDLGFSDIGCYGSEIPTPNIDSLATHGIRFTHFYNGGRSCPTRASLLTGLYPHKAGMGDMVYSEMNKKGLPGYQMALTKNSVTIAETLKKAGYQNFMAGKWHIGDSISAWPCQRGFDRYFGLISGASNYFDITKQANAGSNRILASNNVQITNVSDNFYMTNAITDSALNMIKNRKNDQPFFLYLAYTAPHWPLQALSEDIQLFKGKYNIGWDSLRALRYQKLKSLELFHSVPTLSTRNENVPEWDIYEAKKEAEAKMEVYAAMVYRMDLEIGQLLKTIKDEAIDDNTVIIFLSDNGACSEDGVSGFDRFKNGATVGGKNSFQSYGESWANACNTPFRYFKQFTYEGGIATPAFIYWPSKTQISGINSNRCHVIDIMPTLLDIANIKYPQTYNGNKIYKLQGKSLLPYITGKSDKENHRILAWEHEGNKAIIFKKWKCVKNRNSSWEMYNLESDRSENTNIKNKYLFKFYYMMLLYKQWEIENKVVKFQ